MTIDAKPKVLIVEDEEYRETLKRFLEVEAGWTVITAESAHLAEELVREHRGTIDGIVLDRRMPNRNGVLEYTGDGFAQWLFDENLLTDTCLIMLTGFADVPVTRDILVMGGWNLIEKPVRPREVQRKLAPGIARKRSRALLSWVHSGPSRDEVVKRIAEIINSTLAPDQFRVYFASNGVLRDLTTGTTINQEPSFAKKALRERTYVYASTSEECRLLEACGVNTSTLMAVRVEAYEDSTAVGVMSMESDRDNAFDPRWHDVLLYLAQLIGTAITVARAKEQAVAAKSEHDNLRMLNRELRHRIATSVGTMFQHLALMEGDLGSLGFNGQAIANKAEVLRRHLGIIVTVMKEIDRATKDVPDAEPSRCDPVRLVRKVLSDELAGLSMSTKIEGLDPAVTLWANCDLVEYVTKCLIRNAKESIQAKTSRPSVASDDSFEEQLEQAQSTPPSDIVVTIAKSARASYGEIRVRDEGMGFGEEVKGRLFNALFTTKLTRDEPSAVSGNKAGNSGMGLYSAKRYVTAMGGTLEGASPGEGRGAEFTITLPLAGTESGARE